MNQASALNPRRRVCIIRWTASWLMRLFRHTIAEYSCTKHCGYHRSVPGANLSLFHLAAAFVAAIPLWVMSLREDFPWYYIVSIFAGELLLVYAAGFTAGMLLMPFTTAGTSRCKTCGAPMFFAGRHFDPLGSSKPHWSDIAILIVFVALNVLVWFGLASGQLFSGSVREAQHGAGDWKDPGNDDHDGSGRDRPVQECG